MKKVTDLGPNDCIHVRTEAEDLAIRTLMHEAGLSWNIGDTYLEFKPCDIYQVETVYYPYLGEYGSLVHAKEDSSTIHPATDFLPPRELTIEEAEKEFNIKIKLG